MPDQQTLMGFDFGMKRIGVAVGQTITRTALPLTIIPANDGIPNWGMLDQLVVEWEPDALIVGLPLNMDGSDQEITFCARKFANRLRDRFPLSVHLIDERLTTKIARSALKNSKRAIDSYAAKLIVESWLQSSATEND